MAFFYNKDAISAMKGRARLNIDETLIFERGDNN